MRIPVTEQGLVIPKEFLAGVQAVEIHQEDHRIVMIVEPDSGLRIESSPGSFGIGKLESKSELMDDNLSKTPLGQRLRELRTQIVASGERLLTPDEIEQEIAEQRDRFRDVES
jgi:hypothetical protein